MKILRQSNSDRISNLPANVIERILQFLPIEDAAETATLSAQWSQIWAGTPKLVLNGFLARIHDHGDHPSDSYRSMLNVYKFLMLHDAKIDNLVLKFPGLRPSPDIDHMILYLSKKGVEGLTIIFTDDDDIDYSTCPKSGRNIPNSLFSARQLKFLKLHGCGFQAPSCFVGFGRLITLELKKVHLGPNFFNKFIPKCSCLEYLSLIECELDGKKAEIVAPSLITLIFNSDYRSICFKNTPLLSTVSTLQDYKYCYEETSFEVEEDKPDIAAVFASLPAIEELNVGTEFFLLCTAGHVPYKLSTELLHLKEVIIVNVLLSSLPEARIFVCLIMSSPNLHRLTISLDDDNDDHQPTEVIGSLQMVLEAEEIPATCFQCLEEFNMHDCRGTKIELELLRFVLATGPVLRKITIEPNDGMDSSKGLDFLMEVTQCRRASKEAEVIYLKSHER
ncbi:unnamed protein product [Linum tenue]|uniref:F-box domain-containing protein n=1 Tax=Linum tenue TaxID=586396 RepID=A0AAV0NJD3_9ROSI|nr:unnamed protein product [Linum tenue]